MASFWYTKNVQKIVQNTIDLDGDTFKVGLSTATHVPAKNTDEFADDAGADDFVDGELSGISGYTAGFGGAGRKALVNRTVTIPGANPDRVKLDADDLVWTTLGTGATIKQATVLKEVTNNAASPVIVNLDFTGVATTGGDFTLQFHADGIGYGATA